MAKRSVEKSNREGHDVGGGNSTEDASGAGGSNPAGGERRDRNLFDNPATVFARAIPVTLLKSESRACGLLAAWVRDTVILADALHRAEAA